MADISSAKNKVEDMVIKESQVVELNKSLRSVIEENQKLIDRTQELERELAQLKQENSKTSSEYAELKRDRDLLAKNVEDIQTRNRQYTNHIRKLEKNIDTLENDSTLSVEPIMKFAAATSDKMDDGMHGYKDDEESSSADPIVQDREDKTYELLTRIDAFAEEDEKLRMDAAKAHYNMGNIYYNKGEHELAAREYYQAVALMPDDPDAHFNLAYVSQEYLFDYKTAIKHYQMYLYLNPRAKDRYFVKEQL
ncbi:MAG: tetratricopeptide repeat protein, partial [Candidatus Omnitrophica bacterium]|nr:tetratricopeptide repeat protein [Candidatus Omnitrophota bacterium]